MLGKYDTTSNWYKPDFCLLDFWQREYELVSENADKYLEIAQDSFDTILDSRAEDINNYLDAGKKMLSEIQNAFNDTKSEVSDAIIEYSDMIDEYGKLGSKLVFGVLALMNIALAAFILLICFCSGKMCTNCCCCRCIF